MFSGTSYSFFSKKAIFVFICSFWLASPAFAEKETAAVSEKCVQLTKDATTDLKEVIAAGCKPSQAQISKLMDNPVGNLAMIVMQEDYTLIKGPHSNGYREVSRSQIIPTFPLALGQNWTLVNRVSIPYVGAPLNNNLFQHDFLTNGRHQGDIFKRTKGLGDIVYVGLFAPSQSYKTQNGGIFVWGIGPTISLPTASHEELGWGKYAAGPTAVAAYLGKEWTLGLFPQHWWSFAGDKDRSHVNMTNIQYFIFKNLNEKWRIGMSPNITINWTADGGNKVTLPVGLGLSYTTEIAGIPVRMGAEVQYSVVRPSDHMGSRWNFRFVIVPVIPMFK